MKIFLKRYENNTKILEINKDNFTFNRHKNAEKKSINIV